ncbi:MAG: coenzyme F420-0:L-glutamate ligase [Candidatus Falkowbacteria bacterium]|nr:coenzyme F420-0:L-glutamate ligase [Candidatus Falkowbacteria bacterium]
MIIKAIKTRIFKPRENLISFIESYCPVFKEATILVVTSKIVALSEGRLMKETKDLSKEKIIRQECEVFLPAKYVNLTIRDGVVMANAGVDESNANGYIILLPRDSFLTAAKLRNYFIKKHKLKNFGVIITDSRSLPLRAGISGVALGYAGFVGLKDYRQELDIFGRPFHFSRVDMADGLATAAVLNMGEGNERQPLALITEAPIKYVNKIKRQELHIKLEEDIYGPIFRDLSKNNKRKIRKRLA